MLFLIHDLNLLTKSCFPKWETLPWILTAYCCMGRYLQNKKLWSVLTNTFELKLNFHWGVEKFHKFISLWGLFFYLYLNLISVVSQLSLLSHIFKDTHREEALSSKTPALAKSMIMGIWVIFTSNQLFIRGICHTETKVPSFLKKAFVFSKNLLESWNIENVQNFQWLSHKNMSISETKSYFSF